MTKKNRCVCKSTKRVKYGEKQGAYKTIRGHRYKFIGSSSHEAAGNMEAGLMTRYAHVRKIKDDTGYSFWGSNRR